MKCLCPSWLTVLLILKVDKVLLSTAHAVPTANYKRTTAPVWETAVPGWGLSTHHSQLYLEWRVRKLTVVSPTAAQSTYKTSSCCVYARTSIWWTLVTWVVLKIVRWGFFSTLPNRKLLGRCCRSTFSENRTQHFTA